MVILEQAPQEWGCPNCPVTARTFGQPNRYHLCAGLSGLMAPMIPAGSDARVVAHVREDYEGSEDVQRDSEGRPIASVTVDRPDGSNDVIVYAPTAHARGEGYGLDR